MKLYGIETVKDNIVQVVNWTTEFNLAKCRYSDMSRVFFDDEDVCDGDSIRLIVADVDENWLTDELEDDAKTILKSVVQVDLDEDENLIGFLRETVNEEEAHK